MGRRNACSRFVLCDVDPRSLMKRVEEDTDWTVMCPNECRKGCMTVMETNLAPYTSNMKLKEKVERRSTHELWEKY